MTKAINKPLVSIIMGSKSDWPTMQHAEVILTNLDIPFETKVVSAHRTPDRLYEFSSAAEARGIKVIIAGAGGAAHLPGMVAALTHLPVLGVPVASKALQGLDSLLSIVQMPAGVPVASFAIGTSGSINAAIFAAEILALSDAKVHARVLEYRKNQTNSVPEQPEGSSKQHN